MTKIKLCGIRRLEDVQVLNTLLPDYAGFILTQRFWRAIDSATALQLRSALDQRVTTVGVFVDETPEYIAEFVNSGTIGAVQLHGSEDNAYISHLRPLIGKTPVIKAMKIRSRDDIKTAEASVADMVLLDNGTGTGEKFDWSLLSSGVNRDFILAGGLCPENVAEAVEQVHPYGVDVSGGLETDKLKDPEKMRRFVEAVRNTEKA